MEIELLEIRDFLQRSAPLEDLSNSDLDEVTQALEISYIRRGEVAKQLGDQNEELFLLRTGAMEARSKKGKMQDRLDQHNWFGYTAILGNGLMRRTVVAIEDCLVYVIPGAFLRRWAEDYPGVQRYFSKADSSAGIDAGALSPMEQTQLISTPVHQITNRPAAVVSPDTSIVDVARLMTNQNRTSALVCKDGKLAGIVTEREFCKRVVAGLVDPALPISTVMTTNPVTIEANTSGSEALLTMARYNIHHLPYQLEEKTMAVITASNIVQFQSNNPVFLINDIHSSNRIETLIDFTQKIPSVLVGLVRSNMTAYDIGHLISSVGKAATQRLLVMAEEKLGPPPVPYCWVAAGSLARAEQTAHSDQDNGLILSDDYQPERDGEYFKALADFVCDGLNECGYIYCPGDVMASNDQWRQPWSVWWGYFKNWIKEPEKKSLMYASIFFDLYSIYGDDSLLDSLRKKVLKKTQGNQLFLALLAGNALQFQPPLGLFRQFVLEKSGEEEKALNLKKRGVVPVTDLARVYALSAGDPSLHTEDRLKAAGENGEISQSGMADLIDAYEFIGRVRLEHQCQQIESGETADNHLPPEQLSSFQRHHLKDAFDVVRTMQKALKHRYQ